MPDSYLTSASEISAYEPGSQRLFVTNGLTGDLDVIDLSDPTQPTVLFSIDLAPYGHNANSVATFGGVVVAAVQGDAKTDPGHAVFFDADGNFLNAVQVGALPDQISFTAEGSYVLVANEGEPNDDYTIDPEGSVSVIDMRGGVACLEQRDVRTAHFRGFNHARLDPSIRIYGPGATVAQDLEPEYIASSPDERFAWVTLQENNAIGIIDIRRARVLDLKGLGFKNHNRPGQGLDPSNKDGGIHIASWPVKGMYMPDSIATFQFLGLPFLIMSNEGDSRDYPGFSEEERIGDLTLDPTAFPNAATLQLPQNLGRLKTTNTLGDVDGDGDYDELYSYGARSFSIRLFDGTLIYDSGDDIEQITAAALPDQFNSNNEFNNSKDDRSDDKGPEPEGMAVGRIGHRTVAFVGLERIGGIMIYDVTNPFNPVFQSYTNTRDFAGDVPAGTAGDVAPEGLLVIPAQDSPTHEMLLVGTFEVSGSTSVFRVVP